MATPGNNVLTLRTIALFEVIRNTLRRSRTIAELYEHTCLKLKSLSDLFRQMSILHSKDTNPPQLLSRDFVDCKDLPKSLCIKLGNCLLYYSNEFQEFYLDLISALTEKSKMKIKYCLYNVLVKPDGHMDKQNTIIYITLTSALEVKFHRAFMNYYCVDKEMVLKVFKKYQSHFMPTITEASINDVFDEPVLYWESKCGFTETDDRFYKKVAELGNKESLEYFLSRSVTRRRQHKLSKAAVYVIFSSQENITVEKLLFFYTNMETKLWRELLRRHFKAIFTQFVGSKRYRHMCVDFYSDVKDILESKTMLWSMEFLSENFLVHYDCDKDKELFLFEIEIIMLSIWRLTTLQLKHKIGPLMFRILNRCLKHRRFQVMAELINDPAFDDAKRNEYVSCVAMQLIVFNKSRFIPILFESFPPGMYDIHKLAKQHLTYSDIKTFVIYSDNCKSVTNYDKLLQHKYLNLSRTATRRIKNNLLKDDKFIFELVSAIGLGLVSARRFEAFLFWCCDFNHSLLQNYIIGFLLPNSHLTRIFNNFMVSKRRNFYNMRSFQISDEQIDNIRKEIASQTSQLFSYCVTILTDNDHGALPKMLSCVFKDAYQREAFVKSFFRSDDGMNAVYSMLIEEVFDQEFYQCCMLKSKLCALLKFRKYWVFSDDISEILKERLQTIGNPNLTINTSSVIKEGSKLLPHEYINDMKIIADANYRILISMLDDLQHIIH